MILGQQEEGEFQKLSIKNPIHKRKMDELYSNKRKDSSLMKGTMDQVSHGGGKRYLEETNKD